MSDGDALLRVICDIPDPSTRARVLALEMHWTAERIKRAGEELTRRGIPIHLCVQLTNGVAHVVRVDGIAPIKTHAEPEIGP